MNCATDHTRERAAVLVKGTVQGVGFRPFVYRLASQLKLRGWVRNSGSGVHIEVEGACCSVGEFVSRLWTEPPPRATVSSVESARLDLAGYSEFAILHSDERGTATAGISPDIAPCCDCLRELFEATNRRHRYPFTNCTNCGPRFTIIESLPYDRPHTTMRHFPMCPDCAEEYRDPLSRRFHAQPNACSRCGPQLALWNETGSVLSHRDEALRDSARLLAGGGILALKGVGGFQLLADARNEAAVVALRTRKHREEKPLAVMFPSLEAARAECAVSRLEKRLLLSAEAPIVLLKKKDAPTALAANLAPRNPTLGAMLPSSPLHHLLLRELGFPVVATSGNLSSEPICIDEHEALSRLRGIADFFLVHDRPIVRHMDDSVTREMCGRALVLRRARGYAPAPIRVKKTLTPTLAFGAHLKNAVALSVGAEVFVSQHIGDLETAEAHAAFLRAAQDLPRLYEAPLERVVCDLHPDYLSSQHAREMAAPVVQVQHHCAHIAACMAENDLEPPALGVAWDGTGLGSDGTIWGGEFLLAASGKFERVAHLRTFSLPGGDAAVREPRRSALGVLHTVFGGDLWERRELLASFSESEIATFRRMLTQRINAPLTSSAGRLCDAVAALIGLRERVSFEGQAAMELEFAIQPGVTAAYSFSTCGNAPCVIDWAPAILEILHDQRHGVSASVIAAKFHNMLVAVIVAEAEKVGEPRVVLSGGCFQNKYLTEHAVDRLRGAGFQPFWHQHIPPNDGGIALGQIVAASWADDAAP